MGFVKAACLQEYPALIILYQGKYTGLCFFFVEVYLCNKQLVLAFS